jgi:hypothetical protein
VGKKKGSKSMRVFNREVEKAIRKGKLLFGKEPMPGAEENILHDMQGATEFSAFAHAETIRNVQRRLVEQETQPTEVERVTSGSSGVSRISLAGDRAFANGYDAIFGKKKRKRDK